MKHRKSFMAGFLSGMVPSPFESSTLPSLEGSDLSRLRSDVERVGKQMYSVIEREREENPDRPQANESGDE